MGYMIYYILFALSAALFVAAIYFTVVDKYQKRVFYQKNHNAIYENKYSYSKKLAWITFYTILSVFLLRYAVALFGINNGYSTEYDGLGNLTWTEEIVNSLLHTLQTFSMDEDYTLYWNAGKEMLTNIMQASHIHPDMISFYVGWFSVHTALLNITAPLIDGAIVLGLLARVFPKVRLWFANRQFWREKYYFSELNVNSLAMARSILSDPSRRNSIIVFTDAYYDDEEEEGSELLLEAKAMGGICIKDDITHVKIKSRKNQNTYIMLMDREEGNNVEALTKLLSESSQQSRMVRTQLENSQAPLTIDTIDCAIKEQGLDLNERKCIYVFSTDRKYSFIEDTVERIMNSEKSMYKDLLDSVRFSDDKLESIFRSYFDTDFSDNNKPKLKKLFPDGLSSTSEETYLWAAEDLTNAVKYHTPPLKLCIQKMCSGHHRFSFEEIENEVKAWRDDYFHNANGFPRLKALLAMQSGSEGYHSIEDVQAVSATLLKEDQNDIHIQLSVLLLNEYIKSCKGKRNQLMHYFVPIVIPVNSIKNMSNTLLQEIPLFEPLIVSQRNHKPHKKLKVTIIGAGTLGTELFLSVYSFGQLLGHELQINVVSKEDKITFENKLNYINPEILLSGKKGNPTLICSDDGGNIQYSAPYMDFQYYSADVYSDKFAALMIPPQEGKLSLLDSDYIIVALGSDGQNCEIANNIKQRIGMEHLLKKDHNSTVIAYVVYNPTLSEKLNQNCQQYYSSGKREADIYMKAFGSLDDVYSVRNIFFDGVMEYAEKLNGNFLRSRTKENSAPKSYQKLLMDYYNYKSSNARAMHREYQYYSAWNCLTELSSADEKMIGEFQMPSVFDADYEKRKANGKAEKAAERVRAAYKKLYTVRNFPTTSIEDKKRILAKLAWLEHRRWCAFMRVSRFRSCDISTLEQFYPLDCPEHNKYDHKFLALKSHPCILECSDQGILAEISTRGQVLENTEFQQPKEEFMKDKLDELSYVFYELRRKSGSIDYYDFKRWDYPNNG